MRSIYLNSLHCWRSRTSRWYLIDVHRQTLAQRLLSVVMMVVADVGVMMMTLLRGGRGRPRRLTVDVRSQGPGYQERSRWLLLLLLLR